MLPKPLKNQNPVASFALDYDAANEYVEAHYRISDYFMAKGDKKLQKMDHIYNARDGILTEYGLAQACLEENGFVLVETQSPTALETLDDTRTYYLPELANHIIPESLGVRKEDILSISFWHPMTRGEELPMQPGSQKQAASSPVAPMVHIDTDVGAYGIDGILDLVDKNHLGLSTQDRFDRSTAYHNIQNLGHRFLLLNIWRPLVPVKSSPLGIFATVYSDERSFFPNAQPCFEKSRWYIFEDMLPTECLVFKQYDRLASKPSDLWHYAVDIRSSSVDGASRYQPRKSFDIKAMVVLKEVVQASEDRLAMAVVPKLTLEESGDFCDCQAKARQVGSTET